MKIITTKILFLFFTFFIITSCASKKNVNNNSIMTYSKFRNTQKSFNSNDGAIKYVDEGEGKVILLLHGIPTSAWLYRKMINGLVGKGFRVIAPDMLGFGNSDNPKGYEIYNAKQHSKRLLELMNYLKIQSWTHVTHDAGGLWTWELIKADKKRIEKLILLNTIIYEEGFKPPIRMKKGFFAKFSMWLYKNGVTTNVLLKGLFKSGLKENNLTKTEIEGYKRPLKEGKTNAMYYFFSNTCNTLPNYDNIIESIDIPVAVIWGKHDTMLQWEPQKKLVIDALKINEKNVHLIDAKHFIQEENPEEINKIIVDFLNSN